MTLWFMAQLNLFWWSLAKTKNSSASQIRRIERARDEIAARIRKHVEWSRSHLWASSCVGVYSTLRVSRASCKSRLQNPSSYHIPGGPYKVAYVLGTSLAVESRLHAAEHRRQLDRTHLRRPGPSRVHCDDDRCCDRGCAHHLRRWRAGDGERGACDVATFDSAESHRAECSAPFDGCSVALARPRPALAESSSSAGRPRRNCCWRRPSHCCWTVRGPVLSRCWVAANLAMTQPDEPSWDRAWNAR